jgi:hypothetical protein
MSRSYAEYSALSEVWTELPPADREVLIEEVVAHWRDEEELYPVARYEDLEHHRIEARKLRNMNPSTVLVPGTRDLAFVTLGAAIGPAFLPHIHDVAVAGKLAVRAASQDDVLLRRAVRAALAHYGGAHRTKVQTGMRTIGGTQAAGNFRPAVARYLYETYSPAGGLVYDFAAGWGGRLTGALAARRHYVGVDPCTPTYKGLGQLEYFLRGVYALDSGYVRLEQAGSETFCPPELEGKVDFAFSSPPYFDLEAYSDEPTQSHVKYPSLDRWLDGYLGATARNVRRMLKPGSWCGLNIADGHRGPLVAPAVQVFEAAGLRHVVEEDYRMRIPNRPGNAANGHWKHESILMFRS